MLAHVRATDGDARPTALELRRNVGVLLLSERKSTEATAQLQPLYDDLLMLYGPDHDDTREVAELLDRLRLTGSR